MLKNLYNQEVVHQLAEGLYKADKRFGKNVMLEKSLPIPEHFEMRQRIRHISDAVYAGFSENYDDFVKAATAYTRSFPEKGRAHWKGTAHFDPLLFVCERFGLLNIKHSFTFMEEVTKRYTSEFAIRNFIIAEPELTLQKLLEWSSSSNFHLRRLSSEGSRSRLPWGKKLEAVIKTPALTRSILENLKDDPELYVRKSVANHLNDISKDNLDYFYEILREWHQNSTSQRDWIIKHALRNEVKKGNPEALAMLGFKGSNVKVLSATVKNDQVLLGTSNTLTIILNQEGGSAEKAVVDYKMYLVKKAGNISAKVFKGKSMEFMPEQQVQIQKELHTKKLTIREYHPGFHKIEILVNGQVQAETGFTIIAE